MELVRIDTQRAYQRIRELIVTLELAPGALIHEQQLAESLEMGDTPVREALKLLVHDELVVITPRHGIHVANLSVPDLEQISELRLALEALCARLAAQRAGPDDLAVLDALRHEQASHQTPTAESRRLLELDHRFHQAVARAAKNKYLADTLERTFGLSQRLWYLAMPQLGFLPSAVEKHLDLVEAIKAGDADRAEEIMREHVSGFYDQVRVVLMEQEE